MFALSGLLVLLQIVISTHSENIVYTTLVNDNLEDVVEAGISVSMLSFDSSYSSSDVEVVDVAEKNDPDVDDRHDQGGTTMTFVLDATFSMYNEIQAVIAAAGRIFRANLAMSHSPFVNYALVAFNDPGLNTFFSSFLSPSSSSSSSSSSSFFFFFFFSQSYINIKYIVKLT